VCGFLSESSAGKPLFFFFSLHPVAGWEGDKGVGVWENVKEKIGKNESRWEREPRTYQRQRKMHSFNPGIKEGALPELCWVSGRGKGKRKPKLKIRGECLVATSMIRQLRHIIHNSEARVD
jgi:hypothetical protein